MEKSKLANTFINWSLVFVGFAVFSAILRLGISFSGSEEISIWSAIINLVFCICICIPLLQLKKIVKNIINKNIFTQENIKRFNIIGYPFFILSFISCFVNNKDVEAGIMVIGEAFAIKMESIIFITLGLVAFVIGYIFEEAIKVKNEAENLREESKYTV